MRIAVPAESAPGETRVALVPRSISQLVKAGATVAVQAGAGVRAGIGDDAYAGSGAEVVADRPALLASAELTAVVRRPADEDLSRLREGSALVGMLDPGADTAGLRPLLDRRITAFSLEAMPRISRAQDMDVLSSMATISGYRAAVLAAARLPRLYPLLMTAAGTITPARVLVIGAGVAGLQAIATCRRLGAVVEAFDVRPAVREQVESLGARYVETGAESAAQQDASGYARELGEEAKQRQQQVLAERLREADVVITTALIPNQRAPQLIDAGMVHSMRPGSVIVDLAAPAGGNCAYTKPGEEVIERDVLILGPTNLPADIPGQASQLYSHNLTRFILLSLRDGELHLDFDDEVIDQTCITHEGRPHGEHMSRLLAGTPG
jgi:H+-translocating NAD(P) transhydrogenase subunit alpha